MNKLSYLISWEKESLDSKFGELAQRYGRSNRRETKDGIFYEIEFDNPNIMESFKNLIKSEIPNLYV